MKEVKASWAEDKSHHRDYDNERLWDLRINKRVPVSFNHCYWILFDEDEDEPERYFACSDSDLDDVGFPDQQSAEQYLYRMIERCENVIVLPPDHSPVHLFLQDWD